MYKSVVVESISLWLITVNSFELSHTQESQTRLLPALSPGHLPSSRPQVPVPRGEAAYFCHDDPRTRSNHTAGDIVAECTAILEKPFISRRLLIGCSMGTANLVALHINDIQLYKSPSRPTAQLCWALQAGDPGTWNIQASQTAARVPDTVPHCHPLIADGHVICRYVLLVTSLSL